MAVEDFDEIDDIRLSANNTWNLIIEDELDWEDSYLHASAIQNKLKTYLYFIESGQLLKAFPDAEGQPITICLRSMSPAPDKFYNEMNTQITDLLAVKGLGFSWEFAVSD